MNQANKPKIFYICGRTGGPFFPFPAVVKNLPNYHPIYLGVHNSFEEKLSKQEGLDLLFLPEVKLGILTFSKQKPSELLKNILSLVAGVFLLIYSIFKSLLYLFQYRPVAIFTTGSFLAVPVVVARQVYHLVLIVYNLFFRILGWVSFFVPPLRRSFQKLEIPRVSLILHQQDPIPGLSNKFSIYFATLATCVFDHTVNCYPRFRSVKTIPNPIDGDRYNYSKEEALNKLHEINKPLAGFLKDSELPILTIFGGGSGSLDINKWLLSNFEELVSKYKIVHLSGLLQLDLEYPKHDNYFQTKILFQEMPLTILISDLVLCRAGLGSITELRYLNKKALLVPLPHSHQETNAHLVRKEFKILYQNEIPTWIKKIDRLANSSSLPDVKFQKAEADTLLDEYYKLLRQTLSA